MAPERSIAATSESAPPRYPLADRKGEADGSGREPSRVDLPLSPEVEQGGLEGNGDAQPREDEGNCRVEHVAAGNSCW